MTIPENDETYLDRLLTSEQAAGLPHILNLDPDVNVRTIDQRYLQDAYNYYLGGGRDAAQADFPIQASGITTQVPATTDLGTGEGRTGITATGVATPVVAPFMETSPNVLSAVDNTGQPISGNIVDPTTGDIYAPGDYADVAGTLTDPREKIDTLADTGGRDIPDVRQYADRSWNVDYEALDQEGQAEIDQAYTDLYGIDYTQNTEAQNAWQRVQSGLQSAGDFVRDWGQTAAEKFNELTGNTIDLGRALAGGVTSLVTGIPVIPGLIASQMETPNPYQQKVKEQYEAEGVTLDDLGRVVQTGVYDTPENVMAGYATGPTGVILGGKTIGGKTIQESVVDRLETLEKTKNEKYGGSFYNADGSPKINPDTGKPTTLGDREEALKENLNIVARAAGADTVTEYDPKSKTAGITLGPSEYGFLTDPDELVTAEDLAREQRDEAIEAGIAAADEDAGMLDIAKDTEYDTADFGMTTTGINPFEETQQKTTALDLAKGQPVYNETTGNWEDIDGNIIEDPKKTETDIALASDRYEGRTGIEFVNPAFSNYRTPMLDKIINPKTEKEKRESKELLDGMKDIYGPDWEKKMREEFKNREKKYGPLPEDVELKKTSLVDLTDTGRDDTPTTPDEEFAETGDYDVYSDTPTSGPDYSGPVTTGTVFDAEDEEDYSAPTPSGPPAGGPHGGGRDEPSAPPSRPGGAPASGPHGGGGGNGGGGGGCFLKGTPITMADGTTKPVEQVDLGDEIAEGGKVFAAGRFLTEELYDYEGIKVSGSHMVNEDGTWVRVRDSEKGKPLGDDEHTVYVFGAENRRILINGILFTDYFEVKEQDQLATIGDKYFEEWKDHDKILVNLEEQNNVAMLNR